MNDMQTHEHELISELADGRLEGDAFAAAVQVATRDAAGRAAWETYHLIGEVMRSGETVGTFTPASQFLDRFQARLQAEMEAPPVRALPAAAGASPVARPALAQEAANDVSWRWKWLAGVASVAAVSAIGWNLTAPAAAPQAQVATAAPAATVAAPAGRMIRDPRLDQLLAAHRQLGGASALQTPSGFLRNATFEAPGR